MNEPPGQATTELPALAPGARPRTLISASREVEQEARSALILAPGLFRLDVVPYDDTVQTIVRNLSAEPGIELRLEAVGGGFVTSDAREAVVPATTRFGGEVVLIGAGGSERAVARVLVGSVCHLERGVTGFTAQATLL